MRNIRDGSSNDGSAISSTSRSGHRAWPLGRGPNIKTKMTMRRINLNWYTVRGRANAGRGGLSSLRGTLMMRSFLYRKEGRARV